MKEKEVLLWYKK